MRVFFLSFFFIRAGLASPHRVCDWWEGFSWSGLAVICWLSRVTDVLSGRRTGQGLEIINPFMKVRQGERETGERCSVLFHCPSAGRSQRGDRYGDGAALSGSKGQNISTCNSSNLFSIFLGGGKHTVEFLMNE